MRIPSAVLVALLGMTACQPGQGPAMPSSGRFAVATVRFRIQPARMHTAARAKGFADIHHYQLWLLDGAGQVVTGAGLTNPIQVAAPATTGTLTAVPEGSGYKLGLEAFDAAGVSLSQGGRAVSTNSFAVAGATVTYSAGQEAVCTLQLLDATPGSDTTAVSVEPNDLPRGDLHGIALLNNYSHRAMVLPPSQQQYYYEWQDVQTGAFDGVRPTHEVWGWFASSTTGTAAKAKRMAFPAQTQGVIGSFMHFEGPMATLETVPAGAVTTTLGLRADGAGRVYYSNGTTLSRFPGPSARSRELLTLWGPITGFAVDEGGTVYTTDGTSIRTVTGSQLVGGVHVGPLAVDEEKNLYWFDPATNTIQRARLFFGSYLQPETVCNAAAGTTMLAVDAYGDPCFSNGTDVMAASIDPSGLSLVAPPAVRLSAAGITSLAVDKVGNLYVTDAGNLVKMAPAGNGTVTAYRVAGNGLVPDNGADTLTGVVPIDVQNLAQPRDLCVSPTGTVFFTSAGTQGVGRMIRRM